ncbi:MAG: hypothetical protein H5U40_14910, partial [Polyangiaceae bacterium]|nr:hypothetical protein [Polyangiaceae bacterium]
LAERANVEIPTDAPSTPESRREWARASAERERERLRRVLTAADREEKLPDPAEVLNVWGIGAPVTSDTEVTAWLRGRGIDPAIVEALDLARAMPADVELPRWACSSSGRSYASAGYRLAVPMYDHRGVMRSIRWRALDGRSPKTMASSCKGLVMASPLAVELLAKPATEGKLGSTVILEGEPDFLRVAASDWKLEGQTPAAFGVVQGSIAREWVRRIPAGVLAIAVDDDEPGDRYAAELCTLAGYRMRSGEILAARWRAPRRGMDVGEAGGLDAGTWVFDALTSAEGTNG